MNKLEINMHHLRGAMQYRQAPWAIMTKICFFDGGVFVRPFSLVKF